MQSAKPADWIVHQCRYQLCREHCHCDVPESAWQPLPAISSIEACVLGMQEWPWFMIFFYAHVPRHTEVVPRSAVVLGEPHLRTKDLGGGRCPDCAAVPWPQMFGTWGVVGIWACVLGLVFSMWTAALRQPAWAILTPRGCWEMEAVHSRCVIGCVIDWPVIDRRCHPAVSHLRVEMMCSVACFVYHLRWQKRSVHLFSLWMGVGKPSVCFSDKFIRANGMAESILDA